MCSKHTPSAYQSYRLIYLWLHYSSLTKSHQVSVLPVYSSNYVSVDWFDWHRCRYLNLACLNSTKQKLSERCQFEYCIYFLFTSCLRVILWLILYNFSEYALRSCYLEHLDTGQHGILKVGELKGKTLHPISLATVFSVIGNCSLNVHVHTTLTTFV